MAATRRARTFGILAARTSGRYPVGLLDGALVVAVILVLFVVVGVEHGVTASYTPTGLTKFDTDPSELPYYATRSFVRMLIALAFAVSFGFAYGYFAARSRRAGRVMLPLLDVLQSIPVLGFLSVTIVAFIGLFPGTELGYELASIFAIFTAMAWNLAFSFYESQTGMPREYDELCRMLRLTRWQRFWRIEAPNSAIGMVWNGMMSFGGAWFFLSASEAISVGGRDVAIPGVGSYAAAAVAAGDVEKVLFAILTMVILVVGANAIMWRPLTAWAERFKVEETEAKAKQRSIVLEAIRRSNLPELLGPAWRRAAEALARWGRVFGREGGARIETAARKATLDWVVYGAVAVALALGTWRMFVYVDRGPGLGVFAEALGLGGLTFIRVLAVVAISSLLWIPVGVWIGFNPRISRFAQPLVQISASFPANFLYPFVTALFIALNVDLNWGSIILIALGAQWYVLFNVIAGATAVPTDLREAMDVMSVRGRLRWRRLILPAIFPAYVTGAITAAGGAWNASIVAEIVTYHGTVLHADGVGAFVAEATAAGQSPKVLVGVIAMVVYVSFTNRLLWRPLQNMSASRYSLG